jgi:hypothetical protein
VLNVSVAVEVRALFSVGVFGAPCTDLEIATAERALGHKLPPILQDLYPLLAGWRPSPPMRWRAGASLPVPWPTGDADQLLPR